MYVIPETNFKDYPAIHDVCYDAVGKSLTNDEIDEVIMKLPVRTQMKGITWGWGDTEFRDDLYDFLKGRKR